MSKKYIPSPMSIEEFAKPHSLGDLFETQPCGRCGGCGKYSFNYMYGDTCFSCNGSGVKFTKRGKRQLEAYKSARSKPASEIKVGEKVKLQGYKSFSYPQEIETAPVGTFIRDGKEIPALRFVYSNATVIVSASELVEVALPVEENYRNYVKALSA